MTPFELACVVAFYIVLIWLAIVAFLFFVCFLWGVIGEAVDMIKERHN